MLKKIQALIVDYGGVLIDAPSNDDHLQRVGMVCGINGPDLKRAVFGENQALWDRLKLGAISEAEYHVEVQKNLKLPPDAIDVILPRVFEDVTPHTDFVDYVKAQRSDRLKLAILSNGTPAFTRTWQRLGWLDAFDVVINSCDVKLAKPDPDIYQLALEKLELSAEACIFVDDQAKNLPTPAAMGIHTVLYQTSHQAIAEISKLRQL